MENFHLRSRHFGKDFKWGVSASAYQIEGAHNIDGKGYSIWDIFSSEKKRIYGGHNGNIACNFYSYYHRDLNLMKFLNINNFRFSLSWPRILPSGKNEVNEKGLDFYDRLIDKSLELEITPWITLYHWDLPYELEQKGGWTNRDIIGWFSDYTELCARRFGDRVKHWMILNEPLVFTGAGYFLGIHAPGKKWFGNFLPAVHHAAMVQAEGGRIVKNIVPDSEVGTTFSFSHVEPFSSSEKDVYASIRMDALLNRLFVEPVLGYGYPWEDLPILKRLEKYMGPEDEKKLSFDFDFIGVQNYTREIVKHSWYTPFIRSKIVPAEKRNAPQTAMGWEIYPESIYHILKKLSFYYGVKKIYVTENGAAFKDKLMNGEIHDHERVEFLDQYIHQIHRAKMEGVPVDGYFVWTFLDNFEWTEGYYPRFGLIYVDYQTQKRYIKSSGYWYKQFLEN